MHRKRAAIDHVLALTIAALVVGGSLLFVSAAFGLMARGSLNTSSVFLSHIGLGMGAGFVALLIGTFLDHRVWRLLAPYLFGIALVLTLLVFVPGIGFEHGGARRWIHIANISLQPSEVLKLAVLMMGAGYFATIKQKAATTPWGLGGFLALLALPALILVAQPDIGTLGVISISLFSIYWVAGARVRDVVLLGIIGALAFSAVFLTKPYIRDRIATFLDPSQGQHAESYQIKQSLIAIGSGQVTGRGFGQGIQKFTYLPEPMGDSIFAVAGEELGFVGTTAIVLLFLAFGLRGFHVATKAADPFGTYLAVGIASYLTIEAFINMAAMLGMMPLTGIPLTFISQGGSAMLMSLAAAGVLLGISRGRKRAA